MSQRSVKLKGSFFFTKERWKTIREVVEFVNKVTMRASMLAKVFVLKSNQVVELTSEFYEMCFKVVMNESLLFRKNVDDIKRSKLEIFNELKAIYSKEFNDQFYDSNWSVSQIIGDACNQLETCALNNIEFHYVKHLNGYLYSIFGATHLKSDIAKLRNHLLYNYERPEGFDGFDFPMPPRDVEFTPDLKQRPWIYLKSMIDLSRLYKSKLSPIPLRRSYIPKHIHIDTNALIQLFMTQKDIKEFVTFYELEKGEKPELKNKGSLGNSFEKIFNRKSKNETEEFEFHQEYWKYLCNFKSNKFKQALNNATRDLYFGNSITTDGCSISLSLVSKEKRVKKKFKGRKVVKKKKEEFYELKDANYEDTLFLGCDPGKKDLIAVTDGVNMFKYSKGERDFDTKKNWFSERNLKRRREFIFEGEFQARDCIIPNYYPMIYDPTLAYYEEAVLSRNSSKTCNCIEFLRWMKDKLYKSEVFEELYNKPTFRNDRFTKYTLKESSEDKLLNNLENFINNKRNKTHKNYSPEVIKSNVTKDDFDAVIMFYGDWGKSPNLKNSAPTPGIGLRRKIHKRLIPTVTVNEHYTSKTCPCCRERTLKNPKLIGPERIVSEKHHLLRCENVHCGSRWWNRNVVGSYNILFKGLQLLTG